MRNHKYLLVLLVAITYAVAGSAQVKKRNIPPIPQKQQPVAPAVAKVNTQQPPVSEMATGELHLGRYELYSGIPSIYLGHFVLLPNGKYKVAFDTDEENYDERGTYTWNNDTKTIEWQGGMFRSNNWGGKFTKTEKGFRIQFNKATYGDSK